eukprot:TRINITY_DN3700_c0_g1_i1.p1 TRINITY_DN3700_c0_g1~~TRINITY_DN3700_c0_g1_i1.p1  ORF type:complete len:359 (-),score=106.11 TRINITY_DN3700_c0_g1_i1:59-1135(-)
MASTTMKDQNNKSNANSFKKIDIHCHLLPRNLPDLKKRYGYGEWIRVEGMSDCSCNAMMYKGDRFFREVEPNCWDPNTRIKDCDRDGVTVQAISTIPVYFSYWAKPEDALDLAKMINDDIADAVKSNPSRFIGLGTLPMQSPELAIQELRRCVLELGFPGVQIGTHVNEWNLSSPELFPVFQEAERLGAAIFVHPWDMMGEQTMSKYWLPWLVGMPAETSRAICSMIFGGVFERLPNLRVCFAHGGGSFPITVGRVEHGFNVRPDLCAVDNAVNPRQYLGKFWIDCLVHDKKTLDFVVDLMGAENIVLGSDYPFPLGEHVPGALVEGAESLNEHQKAKILWDNGLRFLGITEDRFSKQ